MLLRILKYVLNIAGLCWMVYLAFLYYALVVNPLACERVIDVIWGIIKELIFFYATFLVLITGVNLFIERKMEKRKTSSEYLMLLVVNFVFLLLAVIYYSNQFYNSCAQH